MFFAVKTPEMEDAQARAVLASTKKNKEKMAEEVQEAQVWFRAAPPEF